MQCAVPATLCQLQWQVKQIGMHLDILRSHNMIQDWLQLEKAHKHEARVCTIESRLSADDLPPYDTETSLSDRWCPARWLGKPELPEP